MWCVFDIQQKVIVARFLSWGDADNWLRWKYCYTHGCFNIVWEE
jgi:hypothetical protein